MKKSIFQIIPKYSLLPLILAITSNLLTYYVTRFINTGLYHYDIAIPYDNLIPFLPVFIVPYVMAYVQWGIGYFVLCRQKIDICYKIISVLIISKILTALIFILFPTSMARPEVLGNGFFEWLTQFIFGVDTPDNLFPSIHCLESWFFLRASFKVNLPSKYKKMFIAFNIVMTIAVFFAVVFVKQHLVLDIFGGILVCEFGYLISKFIHLDKFLISLFHRFERKSQ